MDFVLGDVLAVEVKASASVVAQDLRGLNALAAERLVAASVLVCNEARPRRVGGIEILPWRLFLERLWSDEWGRGL